MKTHFKKKHRLEPKVILASFRSQWLRKSTCFFNHGRKTTRDMGKTYTFGKKEVEKAFGT
jgi:hypothetical protein